MACSKHTPADTLDIKVHYTYHGGERCSLIDTNFNALYGMDYHAFAEFLKEEIPQLFKLSALRVCFQDDEGTFIDLTPQNYHRFLRLSTFAFKTDVPKINIRVSEGASPAPQKKQDCEKQESHSKRNLNFDAAEYSHKYSYRSPVDLEIELKKQEIVSKEKEVNIIFDKYDKLTREYNPNVYMDTSKSVCTKCHLRMGHTKNRYSILKVYSFAFIFRSSIYYFSVKRSHHKYTSLGKKRLLNLSSAFSIHF